jgi:hypothetical protein
MNQQPNQVQIKTSDEKLKGEYANVMQVLHAKEEFVLDFSMSSRRPARLTPDSSSLPDTSNVCWPPCKRILGSFKKACAQMGRWLL